MSSASFETVDQRSTKRWCEGEQSTGHKRSANKETCFPPKLYSLIPAFPQAELLDALLPNYNYSATELTQQQQQQQTAAGETRSPVLLRYHKERTTNFYSMGTTLESHQKTVWTATCLAYLITLALNITTLKTKLRGLSPQANYTDRATATCRRS
jgi:hypothetical protein